MFADRHGDLASSRRRQDDLDPPAAGLRRGKDRMLAVNALMHMAAICRANRSG